MMVWGGDLWPFGCHGSLDGSLVWFDDDWPFLAPDPPDVCAVDVFEQVICQLPSKNM